MSKTVTVIYNSSAIDFFPSLRLPLPAGSMEWYQLDPGFSKKCLLSSFHIGESINLRQSLQRFHFRAM